MDTHTIDAIRTYLAQALMMESVIHESYDSSSYDVCDLSGAPEHKREDLERFLDASQEESFVEVLFAFIEESELNEVDIYRKAGLDRRHFSKIRSAVSGKRYRPTKQTIINLGLSLGLSRPSFDILLASAGYALSPSMREDLIVMFCIDHGIYDVYEVQFAIETLRNDS
ncbi:MAG: hypothetical protein JXK93_05350 [Sphaerochaetaceae bacterium]|nr:hypothetical protein [Sphaerochaetaceae bacterium]